MVFPWEHQKRERGKQKPLAKLRRGLQSGSSVFREMTKSGIHTKGTKGPKLRRKKKLDRGNDER